MKDTYIVEFRLSPDHSVNYVQHSDLRLSAAWIKESRKRAPAFQLFGVFKRVSMELNQREKSGFKRVMAKLR